MNKFWMVWNPNGTMPTYRHDSPDSAVTEAERLAKTHEGCQFFVLCAMSVSQKVTVSTQPLTDPADDVIF